METTMHGGDEKFHDRHLSGRPLFCASLGLCTLYITLSQILLLHVRITYCDYTTLNFASIYLHKFDKVKIICKLTQDTTKKNEAKKNRSLCTPGQQPSND